MAHEDLQEAWRLFKKDFEIYLAMNGRLGCDSEAKKSALLYVIGHPARSWMPSISISEDEDSYEDIVRKIENRCNQVRSETLCDFNFWSRKNDQRQGEDFERFHERVRLAASQCKYGSLHDRLLKSRLIIGLSNLEWQKRLLPEAGDLETVIDKLRSFEAGERNAVSLRSEVDGSNPVVAGILKKYGSTRAACESEYSRRSESLREGQSTAASRSECDACGGPHDGIYQCPAIGQRCKKCDGRDHFARRCPVKGAQPGRRMGPQRAAPQGHRANRSFRGWNSV